MIKHHHETENPGAAARVYRQLSTYLQHNYGIEPRPETVAAARNQPVATIEPRRSAAPIRIQLSEFSRDQAHANDWIEGFRSELLAGLACFRGWSVVEGVQSARGLSNKTDYVLTGHETGHLGKDEFVLTLAEEDTGRVLWSQSFNVSERNFQQAKKKAIGQIAATLEVYVSSDRVPFDELGSAHSVVDGWLRGERLFTRWTPSDHDAAAALYSRLIEQEPRFAPAYASLASIQNVCHIVRPGAPRDAEASRRAHALADHAVELDPLDARNQLAVAWSASLEGDFDKASVHMDLAARLNPHSPRTLVSCAMGFAFLGEHKRALALLSHSLECAPVLLDYQWCYASSVHFLAGDDKAALSAAERASDRIVDNPGWRAAALSRLGRLEDAAAAFDKLVRDVTGIWAGTSPATPTSVFGWFVNAYPMRRSEERDALASALTALVDRLTEESV